MKKLAALLCFLSTTSIAATGTATSTVKIVPGLTITQIQELDFGTFSCTGNFAAECGIIQLLQSYPPEYFGNIVQLGNPTVPILKVTGEYNAQYSLSFDGGSDTVTFYLKKSGSTNMRGNVVWLDRELSSNLSTNEGNGLGSSTITAAWATLTINTNQDPGVYTGSYNIIVNYG